MATGDQHIVSVLQRLVKDDSFDYDVALALLNEALVEVAGRVQLPNLDAAGDVVTVIGEHAVPLPDNYQHGLYMAQNGTTSLTVCNSRGELVSHLGRLTVTGRLSAVAPVGDNLLYGRSPAEATTITLHYYRLPAVVTMKTEPDCFHRNVKPNGERCVESYMAWKIWETIEAGEEGNKSNTTRFETLYEQAVSALSLKIKEGVTNWRPPNVRSAW